MDKRQYEQAFDKFYKCRKYTEALEVVGAMKYAGIPGARYMEMLIFYELGDYERIRGALKGRRTDNVGEREFYLASLAELMMYDEFESYYSEYESISESCLKYISALMRLQGHSWVPDHKAVMEYPTYFDRKYRWFVAELMADIYNLNEEKLMLIEAGIPESDVNELRRKITDKFEMVTLNDAIKGLIRKYVEDDKPIPAENVQYLPLLFSVPEDKMEGVYRQYTELSDIADFLELSCRMHQQGIEEDAATRYWKELSEAVHEGNPYMTGIMAQLYTDREHFKKEAISFGVGSAAERVTASLEKDAPYVIREINSHVMDRDLEATMSHSGRFAYKAAGWKFCTALKNGSGDREGHLLCLSFLRLLEYEINARIIYPLCSRINIRKQYEDFKEKLSEVDKKEFTTEWEYKISCLEKANPRTNERILFAGLITVFDALRFKRYKRDSVHREFAGELRSEVGVQLTDEGKKALADGRLVKMIEPQKLELFRHPGILGRYSGLEMAYKCRNYVEKELWNLADYIIPPDSGQVI